MKKRRDIGLYLTDILDSIGNIEEYIAGIGNAEDFLADKKTYDAVLRNLTVIGEAANKLSEEVRTKYPEIEWRDIVAMRNKLVHEYFGIDADVTWAVVVKYLPELKKITEKMMGDFKKIPPDTYES